MKVGTNRFKAVAPKGATFNYVLPLIIENGTIAGGATSITIPVGALESDPLTVTRTSGTTSAVTVDIETLPDVPRGPRRYHEGYDLSKSGTLPLEVLPAIAGAPAFTETPSTVVEETALLSNYPNPFNPETWIPYQLAEAGDVPVTIYDMRGVVIRQLALGHKPMGVYRSRSRAVHWDGRNQFGEKVATGLYFYTLKAGDFTATRKMLVYK